MNRPANVHVISFDVWLTLFRGNPLYKPSRVQLLADVLGYQGELPALIKLVEESDNNLDKLTEDNNGQQYGLRERVQAVYDLLPTRTPELTESMLAHIEKANAKLVSQFPPELLEEDLLKTFGELSRRDYFIAIISNTGFIDGEHMREVFKQLGLRRYVTQFMFSNEQKIAKPNRAIFRRLASYMNVQPNMVLHVGDNYQADYVGARKADLQACLLLNHKNRDQVTPDMRTTPSIRALLEMLR